MGVSSIVRSLGLKSHCYDRLLDFFHTSGVSTDALARLWTRIVLENFTSLIKINGRPFFVGDGIKVAKAGKKMPSVRLLHQQSESNRKPEYIMGHSFQAIGVLCGRDKGVFSVPLISRIHEGVRFSSKDKRTLLDKMVELLGVLDVNTTCYFVLDAYYTSRNIIIPLLERKWDLITRVKSNAVAYLISTIESQAQSRGREKIYGKKVKIRDLALREKEMTEVKSPVYGEKNVLIKYLSVDLLWRPIGRLVRFVVVVHPLRGKKFLMGTDLRLSPVDIIKIYSYRFKIEVSFKQILRIIGGYAYHFWMLSMIPTKRKAKEIYLHRKRENYRNAVKRKINAYHLFVQTGIIAQGMMMFLALRCPSLIWENFGSWMRTMNIATAPSEFVTSTALRNTLPKFLNDWSNAAILKKFIMKRLDFSLIKQHFWAA